MTSRKPNPRITKEDLLEARISFHARNVMRERHVSEREVAEVLLKGSSHPHRGLGRYVLGDLCVVWDARVSVVVTILLFREGVWTNEDARGRRR
ncbi:hypothetical protein MTE01_29290 [Microbacterium testaceum]|uniref:DUF4258 domain-containing protein n=1 Tax=Microbacterium testaceum TaxID=2033 RepID=A0A4Y3QNV9_MICTE|nr:DUF4258 domain-containing protein [Microbacterium testaceum]GEB46984.1 hypothetical protein MTE01_29290 [Microbacterium testaceum]